VREIIFTVGDHHEYVGMMTPEALQELLGSTKTSMAVAVGQPSRTANEKYEYISCKIQSKKRAEKVTEIVKEWCQKVEDVQKGTDSKPLKQVDRISKEDLRAKANAHQLRNDSVIRRVWDDDRQVAVKVLRQGAEITPIVMFGRLVAITSTNEVAISIARQTLGLED
jgi:hypothetical protein